MQSGIPIENLYYLFCYAWGRFPEGKSIATGATTSPSVVDLLAKVLANGVKRLLKSGLDRGYVEYSEELTRLRGRVQVSESVSRNLFVSARAHCTYDELSEDVLHNQIIKSCLKRLSMVDGVNEELAHDLRVLHRRLGRVSDVRLTNGLFRLVQLHRNIGAYDLLLRICELIHHGLIPEQKGIRSRFADILADEARMSAVFEEFVRNFYRAEQQGFRVKSEWIEWESGSLDEKHKAFLPTMRTDVTLRSDERLIVIDTKYYRQTFVDYMGKERVRASHLYQLFTYLKNLETRQGPMRVEGMLLYPSVNRQVLLDYNLGGHRIRVVTLNLNQPWPRIHKDLLDIVQS